MRVEVHVRGSVQGVGFRPFVYRVATELGLGGWVCNDESGVLVELEGDASIIDEAVVRIERDAPTHAVVESLTQSALEPRGETTFAIRPHRGGAGEAVVPVSVDLATCDACLAEVRDPADRRHGYPFTNCTDCGPRYSIVAAVPYDRTNTTMRAFEMCATCQAEFDDPDNRRFHAQPNACANCGPELSFGGLRGTDALVAAIAALRRGEIVAVKGIGGFHIACDATNESAVRELRRRKARDEKPFAVIVGDVEDARALCALDAGAEAMLTSVARPIVVAPRRTEGARVAHAVAPGLPDLGVMLAYTPLHHLLLDGVGGPLVMTSGNVSDEPIAHDDTDAAERLAPIVDHVLGHDRAIQVRCDDSVVRGQRVLRRSRGLAPTPVRLPVSCRIPVLAVGGELKNTIALTVDEGVIASHHIGDLEHLANYEAFTQAISHLGSLYDRSPALVAHDLHPEYLSTKWALDSGLDTMGVQHHHAHVAACLVEHSLDERVLGVVFDGLGYGDDGTMWGGEFLVADLRSYERVGHLRPVPMPGGSAAIREPWRMAVAWAQAAGVEHGFDDARADAVAELAEASAITTTSVGRLFDAVAALLGVRSVVSFEGQAAIELEALARSAGTTSHVSGSFGEPGTVDPRAWIAHLVERRDHGDDRATLARDFHAFLGHAAAALAAELAEERGIKAVVLSGGVFQNSLLSEIVQRNLEPHGLSVLTHSAIPPNDGGISIGQAAVASSRLASEGAS